MAFNPDEYLEKENSVFNPDAYLSKKDTTKGGVGRAALEAYGNAATLGYLPQIQATVEKILPDPSAKVDAELRAKGTKIIQPDQSYITLRDENIARLEQNKKDFPVATKIGTGAGMGATILAGGLAGGAIKGATAAQRAYSAAKTGATLGAAVNPGDTEGTINPLQLTDRSKNAALGAAVGAGIQGGAEALGPLARTASEWLKTKASKKAARSVGLPTPSVAKNMAKTGKDVEMGRALLDEKAIPWLGTPGRIAKKVEALKEKTWGKVEDLLNKGGDAPTVDGAEAGMRILQSEEIALLREAGETGAVKALEDAAEQLANMGSITLQKAQKIKKTIDKQINYNKPMPDMTGTQAARLQKRTALRDQMDEAASLAGAEKGELKAALRKQGLFEQAGDIAEREAGRTQANRAVSLTDTIAGAAGASTGNPVAALGLTALNKAGRTFGNSIQARGYDAVGALAAKVPALAEFAKRNPVAAQVFVNQITQGQDNKAAPENPILNNPQLMEIFQKNPSLLGSVQDTKLRKQIEEKLSATKDTAIKRKLSSQ